MRLCDSESGLYFVNPQWMESRLPTGGGRRKKAHTKTILPRPPVVVGTHKLKSRRHGYVHIKMTTTTTDLTRWM